MMCHVRNEDIVSERKTIEKNEFFQIEDIPYGSVSDIKYLTGNHIFPEV